MRIIGFCGRKGVGKSFVADLLYQFLEQQALGSNFSSPDLLNPFAKPFFTMGSKIVEAAAFADPIKKFLAECLGVDEVKLHGNDNDKNTPTEYMWDNLPEWLRKDRTGPMTIRHMMQIFGTELNRDLWDKEIWTRTLKRRIDKSNAAYFLITDVRFQNELDKVHEWGGKVWKIEGPQRGNKDAANDAHQTEKVIDGTVRHDIVIRNEWEDTPETLLVKVKNAIKDSYGSL